ncbi:MAG: NCS2 family permease [candidate division KSB1 bacterium]|nr:NCS2 family permease [candidate division KSB1 bacterium]
MESLFKLKQNQSTVKTEVLAGIATFLATMYIIVVNPGIIQNTGMSFSGVLAATVLVSAFSSIAMGIYANNPIVLAPGMGLNAFFTYSVVIGMGVKWEVALGAVFWSGVIFLILSVLNVRTAIVKAIPRQLRYAIACGIGLFITMIGFMNAGFITASEATIVTMGGLNLSTITFLVGLAITAILVVKRVPGALILGIAITTVVSIPLGRLYGDQAVVNWQGLLAAPDFGVFLKLDFFGSS